MSDAELRFTIPGPPVPQARARAGRGGHHYTPAKSRAYLSRVRDSAHVAMVFANAAKRPTRDLAWAPKGTGPFAVELDVYRAANRGDADNFAKGIKDGMTRAGVWLDDRYVTSLAVRMHIDRSNPRAEVIVRRLEP
jgi:Holliday junction resolvase RusA-like endonuclease